MAVHISESELDAYFKVIEGLSERAGGAVFEFFNALDWGSPEIAEAALIDAMAAVIEYYGNGVASAGAGWIQQTFGKIGDETAMQIVANAAAEALQVAARVDTAWLARGVSAQMPNVLANNETRTMAARVVASKASAEAKRRGYTILNDTISRADATSEQLRGSPLGLMVMWVPRSAHPCGWCTMLASNSWRVARGAVLEDYKEHIHENCSCQQVFKPADVTIGGVRPKYYKGMVDAVRHPVTDGAGNVIPQYIDGRANPRYWHEVRNAINRANYNDPSTGVGDRVRAQHREEYAAHHDEETD